MTPPFRLPIGLRLLVAACLLAACAPAATEAPPGTLTPAPTAQSASPPGAEARSAKPRELAPEVSSADLEALADGNCALAVDLYQAVRGEGGNLFYSPYSISLALAMTYAGARGETETEMAQALHYTLPQDKLHLAFNAADLALTTTGEGEDDFELNIANGVWGQQDHAFEPDFLDVLAVNYGAGLRLANFEDAAEREEARQTINAWVSDATEGRIEDLFPEGVFNEATRLVLANAIYFKADWDVPFMAEDTRPAPFTLLDGSTVQADTMTRRGGTRYAAGDGFEALELDYKGGRMSMVILLPAAGQFEAFEAELDAALVEDITARLEPADLQIYMPKFTYAAKLDLGQTLASMGMPSAFEPGTADFSGMDGQRDLMLTSVLHKAFVAVDEKGTEAAAATGVTVGATSMPEVVAVDRPFVYLIRDRETGMVLFVGRVLNPTE